jgi:hypothetical protein
LIEAEKFAAESGEPESVRYATGPENVPPSLIVVGVTATSDASASPTVTVAVADRVLGEPPLSVTLTVNV